MAGERIRLWPFQAAAQPSPAGQMPFSAPTQNKRPETEVSGLFGGDKRDRTADLLTASQALSQLSYTPIFVPNRTGLLYQNQFALSTLFSFQNQCFNKLFFREGPTANLLWVLGGDKRDRTADLLTASQALSQLSYTPIFVPNRTGLLYQNQFALSTLFSFQNQCFNKLFFREGPTANLLWVLGGDKRDRTADLLTASQALSQLSYTPKPFVPVRNMC